MARKIERSAKKRPVQLMLTCEHGGNRIPREYAHLFRGAKSAVQSHRGWDPGALDLAHALGRSFGLPVHEVTWCRLLVESNRAPTNPRIWSEFSADLPAADKTEILERYWWPHRRAVEAAIARNLKAGRRVLHVAVHSFTPVMSGVRRNADIGLLYDSRRATEKVLCERWQSLLEAEDDAVRVRRNYPYIGATDGFPTWLRRRHGPKDYAGIELEVNQALFAARPLKAIHRLIARTLEQLLDAA